MKLVHRLEGKGFGDNEYDWEPLGHYRKPKGVIKKVDSVFGEVHYDTCVLDSTITYFIGNNDVELRVLTFVLE